MPPRAPGPAGSCAPSCKLHARRHTTPAASCAHAAGTHSISRMPCGPLRATPYRATTWGWRSWCRRSASRTNCCCTSRLQQGGDEARRRWVPAASVRPAGGFCHAALAALQCGRSKAHCPGPSVGPHLRPSAAAACARHHAWRPCGEAPTPTPASPAHLLPRSISFAATVSPRSLAAKTVALAPAPSSSSAPLGALRKSMSEMSTTQSCKAKQQGRRGMAGWGGREAGAAVQAAQQHTRGPAQRPRQRPASSASGSALASCARGCSRRKAGRPAAPRAALRWTAVGATWALIGTGWCWEPGACNGRGWDGEKEGALGPGLWMLLQPAPSRALGPSPPPAPPRPPPCCLPAQQPSTGAGAPSSPPKADGRVALGYVLLQLR